jgi:ATPase subunit of ABC transporter with duplicated ATPase domains
MRKVDAILRSLANKGKAILVVSHDTEFLSNACDRVIDIENSSRAARDGCAAVSLLAESSNPQTIKFYEREGFEAVFQSDKPYPYVRLVKRLQEEEYRWTTRHACLIDYGFALSWDFSD